MKPLKPYKRRRWRLDEGPRPLWFFTCARPGRTADEASKASRVSDDIVHRWVLGLPRPLTAIVSLLGWKPDGMSEFHFYSFHGGSDLPSDAGSMSFEAWLDKWHSELCIVVREHPTYDFRPIPPETLEAVSADIRRLAAAGRTVVLIDSGGETRTRYVCRHMKAVEDTSSGSA